MQETEEEEEAENQTSGEWDTDQICCILTRKIGSMSWGFGFLHDWSDKHKNKGTVC